jgi:ferredoxin-NADP reductase
MQKYDVKLVEIKNEYDSVFTYGFTSEKKITWTAGQYVHLIAPTLPVNKTNVKHMSFASTQDEKIILFSMDLSSQSIYKRQFAQLALGDTVSFFKIKGHFVLDPAASHVVFIAGGIGVTPIRSLLVDIVKRGLPVNWQLIHVARGAHLYDAELTSFGGNQTRINRAGLETAVANAAASSPSHALYYVSGSDRFVQAVIGQLGQRV